MSRPIDPPPVLLLRGAADPSPWHAWLRTHGFRDVREADAGRGTAALREAARAPGPAPLVVVRGDVFFTGAIGWLVAFHGLRKATATLALVTGGTGGPCVTTGEKGVVTALLPEPDDPTAWRYAGVAVLGPRFLAALPEADVPLEALLPRWVGSGLYGCRFPDARCLDLTRPDEARRAARWRPVKPA